MKRVLLVGGGTAGHVEPALAVGKWLTGSGADISCEFLGTSEGIETVLVPNAGFTLLTIRKSALPRRMSPATLMWPLEFLQSFIGAVRAVRGADLVIGFGGYVSAPAYLAAKILRTPFIVHEANALPGWANRLGARLTEHLDIAFASTRTSGDLWRAATLVGAPIRPEIALVADLSASVRNQIKSRLAAEWKIDLTKPVLFIFGGSLGARAMNQAVAEFLLEPESSQLSIIHAVGRNDPLPQATGNYKPLAYIDNMAEIYAIADLIISRSGAVSCAEIESVGVPAILVPLPIGNGEQEANARDLVESGQAQIVLNSEFTGSWLAGNILSAMNRAQQYSRGAKKSHHIGAVAAIGEQALAILKSRGGVR